MRDYKISSVEIREWLTSVCPQKVANPSSSVQAGGNVLPPPQEGLAVTQCPDNGFVPAAMKTFSFCVWKKPHVKHELVAAKCQNLSNLK